MAAICNAQTKGWSISAFAGESQLLFGSHDKRRVSGLGVAYDAGDYSKFRWGSRRANLMGELYYSFSTSSGFRTFPPDSTSAIGALIYARYKYRGSKVPGYFVDLGWGIQYSGQPTHDLQSKLNSTPFIDLGLILGSKPERTVLGARLMHISNARTNKQNDGQNHFMVFVQIPF